MEGSELNVDVVTRWDVAIYPKSCLPGVIVNWGFVVSR